MSNKAKKKRPLSIKTSIFISMIALTAVMISLMWVMQNIFINAIYGYTREKDVNRASRIIAENADNDNLSSLISQICIEYELCAKLVCFDEQTSELHDKHFLNDCILHKISDYDSLLSEWYDNAKENDNFYTEVVARDKFRDFDYDKEDFEGSVPEQNSDIKNCLIAIRLVDTEDGGRNMLILNASLKPLYATVRAIRIMFIIISVIFVIFSLVISYFLSRRLSKPIEQMNAWAKNLTIARYDITFPEKGPSEICELAKTLNTTTQVLSKLDKLQKELISNISHDLRTPLTMISGYSEVMRDIPGENTPENMQVIIDEAARLTSLVNDLLNVSKLQSGTQVLTMKKINLTTLIIDTVQRYERLIQHDGYKISFNYESEAFVEADETRLLQVVYNLINNAINYTGQDKSVVIEQTVQNGIVKISITDTGEGICEEDLPLIWDRYYKVDKVHKRAISGTGLGLSIVKNILLLHGSRFGVSSELGKGSTFWFEFKEA